MSILLGVDLVSVDRIAKSLARNGSIYLEHVLTRSERDCDGDKLLATAAGVAAKESLIKAVGGRAPGFTWHDFEARDGLEPAVMADAIAEVESATAVALTEVSAYTVRGASRFAAATRLAPERADTAEITGAARWGRSGDVIVALAILTIDPKGERE